MSGTGRTTTKAVLLKAAPILVHKLSIALKELRETRGWLFFVTIATLLPETRITELLDEADQSSRIIGRSIATAKGRPRKDGPPSPAPE